MYVRRAILARLFHAPGTGVSWCDDDETTWQEWVSPEQLGRCCVATQLCDTLHSVGNGHTKNRKLPVRVFANSTVTLLCTRAATAGRDGWAAGGLGHGLLPEPFRASRIRVREQGCPSRHVRYIVRGYSRGCIDCSSGCRRGTEVEKQSASCAGGLSPSYLIPDNVKLADRHVRSTQYVLGPCRRLPALHVSIRCLFERRTASTAGFPFMHTLSPSLPCAAG